MNPFEQMELKKMSLTKKELAVYEIFSENIDDILRNTATAMAEKYHVSQPAITRFCQKLGYQGYNDFKFDVYKYYKGNHGAQDTTSVIDYYSKLIHLIPGAVSDESFTELARRIVSSRYIAVCGCHKSSLPAQLLNINLGKTGILSSVINVDNLNSLITTATEKDTVIFFSVFSPIFRESADQILEMAEDKRPFTVLITQTDKHPIRNRVDQVIWLPSYRNQGYSQYLESQVVPMIFVDLLTNYITDMMKEENSL